MLRPTREFILDEIKRYAEENGGAALGRRRFEAATGIKEADWLGRYWVRWGDALQEAGFAANTLQGKVHDDNELARQFALLTAELSRFPTDAEIQMRHRADPSFPSHGVFAARLGRRAERAACLDAYVNDHPEFEGLRPLYAAFMPHEERSAAQSPSTALATGFVYLVRSGKHHKIGRSNNLGRRSYEIALQLPERLHLVHAVETDDPPGIERYWHERFSSKRANGEWFLLLAEDVAAFKARRRFM